MNTVLITDCDHPSTEIEEAVFARAGITVRRAACRTAQDVIEAGADAVGLLSQYAPITEEVMAALPTVRVIGRYGVGLDNIDVAAAERRGLHIVSVPDYCTDEVADHAFGLILSHTRGYPALDRAVRRGVWDFRAAGEIRRASEMRLGIIGLGRIGSAVARRALASKFQVVAYDPNPHEMAGVSFVAFDRLLASSDIVTLHAPLNASTHHLLNASAFAKMKRGAFLVNTARGGLIDQKALTSELVSGRLGGAALDVLELEPIDGRDELLGFADVTLTPHAAFYSREAIIEMKQRVATGIAAALGGCDTEELAT